MNFLKVIGSHVYKGWMTFARVLGVINMTLLLILVCVLVNGPVALVLGVGR